MSTGLGGGGSPSLLAQAYMRISIDRRRLASELGSCVSLFKRSVASMIGTAAGLGAALAARAGLRTFTSAVQAVGAAFIQTNSQMESFRMSLGVLLKDQSRANSLMLEIEKFAAVTPFQTQNLAEAVTRLKVFGFETEKLMPIMKTLGDAASASPAGMQLGLQRIIYAIGQIRATGKVGARELRQLALAGIPVWDILAQKSGKSVEELRAQIKKGALSADEGLRYLLSGMDERFGGMMQKASRTWTGLMSTIKDNARIFARQTGQDFFALAEGRLANIVDWSLSPKFKQLSQSIRGMVREVSTLAGNKIDAGMEWLKAGGAEQIARSIKGMAESFVKIGGITFKNLAEFFTSKAVRELGSAIGELTTKMVELAGTKLTAFTEWLNKGDMQKFVQGMAESAESVAKFAVSIGELAGGYWVFSKIADGIQLVGSALVKTALGAAGGINPVSILVAAITALGAAYISSKIAGEDFGEHLLHLEKNILGVDNALSKLEAHEAGEKGDNKAFGALEDALKKGDAVAARSALETIRTKRGKAQRALDALPPVPEGSYSPFTGDWTVPVDHHAEERKHLQLQIRSYDDAIKQHEDDVRRSEVFQQTGIKQVTKGGPRREGELNEAQKAFLRQVEQHDAPLFPNLEPNFPKGQKLLGQNGRVIRRNGHRPAAVEEGGSDFALSGGGFIGAIRDSETGQWLAEQYGRASKMAPRNSVPSAIGGAFGNILRHPIDSWRKGTEEWAQGSRFFNPASESRPETPFEDRVYNQAASRAADRAKHAATEAEKMEARATRSKGTEDAEALEGRAKKARDRAIAAQEYADKIGTPWQNTSHADREAKAAGYGLSREQSLAEMREIHEENKKFFEDTGINPDETDARKRDRQMHEARVAQKKNGPAEGFGLSAYDTIDPRLAGASKKYADEMSKVTSRLEKTADGTLRLAQFKQDGKGKLVRGEYMNNQWASQKGSGKIEFFDLMSFVRNIQTGLNHKPEIDAQEKLTGAMQAATKVIGQFHNDIASGKLAAQARLA